MTITEVIIVGAGPAGIGVASLLNQTDINFAILEKGNVGTSFLKWPQNMEMITPSFPSNAFGQIDLNSICEGTSPAFSFKKEHLNGDEYAEYLELVTNHFGITVHTQTEVLEVQQQGEDWIVKTNQGTYLTKYVVWAAGEYQNPQIKNITGSEHCVHSSIIRNPNNVNGDNFVIIGGYESGVQLAHNLIALKKEVTIINPYKIDDHSTSDPSRVLSPYTFEKYEELATSELYKEVIGEVSSISKNDDGYYIHLKDADVIKTKNIPICATGFDLVKEPIEQFINYREDGSPALNKETDEFLGQNNLYLAGPSVRHDNHIFCFIYKFRQRFGVIAEDILKKEGYNKTAVDALVERWKVNGMYLSDLSCCDDECVC